MNSTNKIHFFLNEFTEAELKQLSPSIILEGVAVFANSLTEDEIYDLIEEIEKSVYVLSESNNLTSLEEKVLLEIVGSLKNIVKGAGKWAARGAGYLGGLATRVAKGMAHNYGSGYSRGRGTTYVDDDDEDQIGYVRRRMPSSQTSTTQQTQPTSSQQSQSRGFRGTTGIRASIGRSFRQGVASQINQQQSSQSQQQAAQSPSQRQRLVAQGQRINAAMSPQRVNMTPAPASSRVTMSGQQRPPLRNRPAPTVTMSNRQTQTTPAVGSPTPARAPNVGPQTRRRPTVTQSEGYVELSSQFIDYLIESGYADDFESGLVILENFSDEAIETLID